VRSMQNPHTKSFDLVFLFIIMAVGQLYSSPQSNDSAVRSRGVPRFNPGHTECPL